MQRLRVLLGMAATLLLALSALISTGAVHAAPTSSHSQVRITVLRGNHPLPDKAVTSNARVVFFHPHGSAGMAHAARAHYAAPPQGSGDLAYSGGPIQHNPASYLIYWGSGWTDSLGNLTPTGAVPYNYMNDLSGTAFENILTQYHDNVGYVTNIHTLAGAAADGSTPPTDSTCGGPTIEDSSIQNEVSSVITAMGWPNNSDATYFVFTPNGYYVNSGGSCSEQVFCAYHNWSSAYGLSYAAMAYPFGTGCQVPSSPNGDQAGDSLTNVTSHEQFEAITDPQPPSGWVDAAGYEIGDKCAWDFSAGYTYLNSGGVFELQTEYSNATSSCVNAY